MIEKRKRRLRGKLLGAVVAVLVLTGAIAQSGVFAADQADAAVSQTGRFRLEEW